MTSAALELMRAKLLEGLKSYGVYAVDIFADRATTNYKVAAYLLGGQGAYCLIPASKMIQCDSATEFHHLLESTLYSLKEYLPKEYKPMPAMPTIDKIYGGFQNTYYVNKPTQFTFTKPPLGWDWMETTKKPQAKQGPKTMRELWGYEEGE